MRRYRLSVGPVLTLTSSARCARAIPRFQFGSHWDVIEARAASITPINAIATKASMSVKPGNSCHVSYGRFG